VHGLSLTRVFIGPTQWDFFWPEGTKVENFGFLGKFDSKPRAGYNLTWATKKWPDLGDFKNNVWFINLTVSSLNRREKNYIRECHQIPMCYSRWLRNRRPGFNPLLGQNNLPVNLSQLKLKSVSLSGIYCCAGCLYKKLWWQSKLLPK